MAQKYHCVKTVIYLMFSRKSGQSQTTINIWLSPAVKILNYKVQGQINSLQKKSYKHQFLSIKFF